MKLQIVFFFAFCFAMPIFAQTDSRGSVLSMSPKELDQKLNDTVREPRGPVVRRQLCAEAMASNRVELIQACFSNPLTVLETAAAIAELPNVELKQRATIMMLRTPSGIFWPSENAGTEINSFKPKLMVEPFISVIPQLLPKVQLNENWLKYSIGRTKLADDMEAVLNAKDKPDAKMKSSKAEPTDKLNLSPSLSQSQPIDASPSVASQTIKPGLLVYWIAAGVALLVAFGWLMQKR